tara:strand:- start:785 stop:1024 length:240 start_codon:yes stop_codon:yes gene_type:complete
MTYYLLLEGDSEKDAFYDSNILGEESLGTFYPGQGLIAFNNIVNKKPELLEKVIIKNDKNQKLSIDEFFDIIGKLKIRR